MLAAASLALASQPGCAFIFTQGPPPAEVQAKDTYFDCSGSWVPVIVDALAATAAGINAADAYNSQTVPNPHGVAVVAAGLGALFATSAIYGVTEVASCGRAKTARLERKQRENLLPPPYGMPPWGEPPPGWPPPVAFYRAPAPVAAPKAGGRPAAAPAVTPESPMQTEKPESTTEKPGGPKVPAPAAPVFKREPKANEVFKREPKANEGFKAAPPAPPPGS